MKSAATDCLNSRPGHSHRKGDLTVALFILAAQARRVSRDRRPCAGLLFARLVPRMLFGDVGFKQACGTGNLLIPLVAVILMCSRASSYCSSAHPSFSHSAKGIWMARIGSTFTADQQFDPFTQMPAFLIGICTAPVRPSHNIRNCARRTGHCSPRAYCGSGRTGCEAD
jgi:hypothetical protein